MKDMQDKNNDGEESILKPWKKPEIEIISKDRIQAGSVPTSPEGVFTPGTFFVGSGS